MGKSAPEASATSAGAVLFFCNGPLYYRGRFRKRLRATSGHRLNNARTSPAKDRNDSLSCHPNPACYQNASRINNGHVSSFYPPIMKGEFVSLIHRAATERLCTRWGCTTCGAHDFRQALRHLHGGAIESLSLADLNNLQDAPSWRDCTLIALWDLGAAGRSAVLRAWLRHVRHHIRLADIMLFYVVRGMSLEPKLAAEWIDTCKELAGATGDISLIESLIYTLKIELPEHTALRTQAEAAAPTHPVIQRALDHTQQVT